MSKSGVPVDRWSVIQACDALAEAADLMAGLAALMEGLKGSEPAMAVARAASRYIITADDLLSGILEGSGGAPEPVPAAARVRGLMAQLVAAIEAEAATYRATPAEDTTSETMTACNAATDAVRAIKLELVNLPLRVEVAPDLAVAMALVNKHSLVMEAAYSSSDAGERERVQLVEAVLSGTPYGALPWMFTQAAWAQEGGQ